MPAPSALRRRIIPAYGFRLAIRDADGTTSEIDLRLAWDYNAFAAAEDRCGVNISRLEAWRDLNPKMVASMLWAAAVLYQPEYGNEEGFQAISSYLDLENGPAAVGALFEAYLLSLPPTKAAELRKLTEDLKKAAAAPATENPVAAAVPTSDGSSSGPLPATTSDSQTSSSEN